MKYSPITIFISVLLLVSCSRKTKPNSQIQNNTFLNELNSLKEELGNAKNEIIELKETLESNVKDKDDKETPYKILVDDGLANKVKLRAIKILKDYPIFRTRITSLETIKNGCENQNVPWDEYCFKDMPWFGVEPIINLWLSKYDEAIEILKE